MHRVLGSHCPGKRGKGWLNTSSGKKALTAAAAHDKDKNRRTWAKAICILHDLPAADVVAVVRCEQCAHGYDDISGRCCIYADGPVKDDFFCRYGE